MKEKCIMKILKIEDNFWMYHIPAASEGKLGVNMCVLLDDKKALLIDAGYQKDARQVLDDLNNRGIEIVKVLPTHYHPDHVEGLLLMDSKEVYGNSFAIITLKRFYDEDEISKMAPNTIVDEDTKLTFGEYTLTFLHAPGHSNCSMLININNKYILLGDLYIKTDKGDDVLPYVAWADVKAHIDSLDNVPLQPNIKYLISHGTCPCSFDEIKIGISNRKIYLQALLDSDNTIAVDEAVKNCTKPFKFLKWRESVK